MNSQRILDEISAERLSRLLEEYGSKLPMLVCDNAYEMLSLKPIISEACPNAVVFNKVQPNPRYEDFIIGFEQYKKSGCDAIISVGGGSAIDSAKCIEAFSAMEECDNYLEGEHKASPHVHICIPTTAGTGSESTRYAIVYKDGKKYNFTDDSIIPDCVFLLPKLLKTLPEYQKKATLLDALSHAIESYWACASTDESKVYSKRAILFILKNINGYLNGNEDAAAAILLGSNFAGKAINIAATTAAHAMGYKLTSGFHIAHGHAVALGLLPLWRFLNARTDRCCDKRGEAYLKETLGELDKLTGGADNYEALLHEMVLELPTVENAPSLDELTDSVDPEKLKNFPIKLERSDIYDIYAQIIG